jgi:hypothetical protein
MRRNPLARLFSLRGSDRPHENVILPIEDQKDAWRRAHKRMKWRIPEEEFTGIGTPSTLTEDDWERGFRGVALFRGFGGEGTRHADAVLSGMVAWDYACRSRRRKAWRSPHINFDKPDYFRLRPGAPPRPKGFYFAKIQLGERFQAVAASYVRKYFISFTGCGPEGLQFLCITHPHFADLMSERKMSFMVLADYDVAPYGFNDFFDVPQLFSSNGILGLGVGNAGQGYPGFGVPTIHF